MCPLLLSPTQVSASFLVVVGLLCLTKETLFDGDGQIPEAFILPIVKAVVPWLSGEGIQGGTSNR